MKKFLLATSIIAITFYCIGNLVPIKILVPNINWAVSISSGEFFYYCICTIQAIATVAAVVIALFSDSIKSYFRKPILNIDLHNPDLAEELESNTGKDKKAKRYHNSIDVFNVGNINAENCEIFVESIKFKGLGMNAYVELLQNEYIIYWSGEEKRNNTYIPVQGKKSFCIYEIFPPEEQSNPEGGNSQQVPPQLSIGGFKIPDEYCGGIWNVYVCLYSPSLKPTKFKVTIDWDGKWENRQMEMKAKIKNSITL